MYFTAYPARGRDERTWSEALLYLAKFYLGLAVLALIVWFIVVAAQKESREEGYSEGVAVARANYSREALRRKVAGEAAQDKKVEKSDG